MSGSDWRKFAKIIGLTSSAFLVICLVYFFGFAAGNVSGNYEGQASRAADQYADDTKRIIDGCFKLPSRTASSECVAKAYEASHENQRAEYDLKAQRDMSEWAWWVMIIGILQFLATIATLGFVKLTLDATLEAVRDTTKATKAMELQNEIAEGAQRAWVSLSASPRFIQKVAPDGLYIRVEFTAKNIGATPATDFDFYHHLLFRGQQEEGDSIDRRMRKKIEEWKSEYEEMGNSTLLPNDVEVSSIWDSFSPPEVKWWDRFIPKNDQRAVHPYILAAVFYRTVSKPSTIQLSWRAWKICSFHQNGQIASWVPMPARELDEAALCIETFYASLMHEEYTVNDDTRHHKG